MSRGMYLLCATMVPWSKTHTGLKYNSQSQALKPNTSKKVVIGLVKSSFFFKRSIRHALEGLYLEACYKTRHKLESNISLHIKTKNLKKTLTLKKNVHYWHG